MPTMPGHRSFRWDLPAGFALGWQHLAEQEAPRALLYLPGFSDLYFQTHVAEAVTEAGWQFWALEPHLWGRALSPGDIPCHCQDLSEFLPDLEAALGEMKKRGAAKVAVLGHSTGGLLALAAAALGRLPVEALILNSPFVQFNLPVNERRRAQALLPLAGRLAPRLKVRAGLSRFYGESIHKSFRGEWDFDLKVKPVPAHPTTLGFLWAAMKAHQMVESYRCSIPTLVLASSRSWQGREWSEEVHTSDAVLNVADMEAWSARAGAEHCAIEGARHDVFLSREPALGQALAALRRFLDRLGS